MIDFARERRILVALMAALACAGACGGKSFVSVGKGKGNSFDTTGLFDAGADGSLLDGSAQLDGSGSQGGSGAALDGGLLDGSVNVDAGPPEVDPTQACSLAVEYSNYSTPTLLVNEGGFSLASGKTGYGLVFGVRKSGPGSDTLNTMSIDSAGQFGTVTTVYSGNVYTDAALLWTSAGWRMAWVDNLANTGEVETIALTDTLEVPSNTQRTTLTNNDLTESRPVLADIAGVPLLAWITSDSSQTTRGISGARLDAAMKVVDFVPGSAGHKPASLALARMGKAGAALAWVEDSKSAALGVWLQTFDDTGNVSGQPVQMSDQVSVGNSVDLATRDDIGGATVYSVTLNGNQEVRFRRLDAKGAFTGQDIKLIGGALQATDASLARLGGGYVVAYRALIGGTITKAGIRFMIVSKEGNVQRDPQGRLITFPLADASGAGGRTRVQVSTDGQILVAFLDGNGNLRLARQRLDCGL